jgi:hypothetical protein
MRTSNELKLLLGFGIILFLGGVVLIVVLSQFNALSLIPLVLGIGIIGMTIMQLRRYNRDKKRRH